MAELAHNTLQKSLAKASDSPVWLIYGEEFLVDRSLKALVGTLLPGGLGDSCCEVAEGDAELRDALEQVSTFSLFSSGKVVVVRDSHIFYAKKGENKELAKITKAYDDGKMQLAARRLAQLLSKLKLQFKHLSMPKGLDKLKALAEDGQVPPWTGEVAAWAEANRIVVPEPMDDQSMVERAIRAGFPAGHHLVLTTDQADKRKSLFKAFKECGSVVDCSAPKGERKADKDQQAKIIDETVKAVLSRYGKKMDPRAVRYLVEMVGFDLRVLVGDVEKLCSFVGDNPTISYDDARRITKKTKQDPIYELTGAISERNGRMALSCVRNLLANETHPLQVLAALVNQVRRLLLARSFLESREGRSLGGLRDYNQFRAGGINAVKAADEIMAGRVEAWQASLALSKKKTDLLLNRGGSPYPLFLLLQNAARFSMAELTSIHSLLADCDRTMKSSPEDPTVLLDRIILRICIRDS
ncbi:DNA polymerase III subunit delta [Desulfoluna spongiiphila]|uniref:DNA polymerase III subunit delta n=1 Tax=Desulfoluna spongiiphila TaxID=419481 RepID=UPI0012528BC2|nr:hypothetical protein [Desulfoluna spongiiphila]VVS94851.1 dna polymerase iii delta n-terminal [Desulfoluna spongiiphila]